MVIYATPVKTDRMAATKNRFQGGTLEIGTAGMSSVLVTYTFSGSAGSVLGDAWTMGFTATSVPASGAGIAAAARVRRSGANGGGIEISGLTVSTADADINLDNTDIRPGQSVTLISAVIQHAS
jgi:hypothetical protein